MDFNMRANEGQLRTVKFETAALQFEANLKAKKSAIVYF